MKIKLAATMAIFCIVFFVCSGCGAVMNFLPAHNEIQKQAIVTVLAIDKGEKQTVLVSLLIQSEGAETGGGGSSSDTGSGKAILLKNEANSVAKAIDNMQAYTDNTVFLGHIDYYLMGEDTTYNLPKYLDFVTREHSMRFNSGVYVTKGKASDLLEAAANGDFNVSKRIRSLEETAANSSKAQRLTLISLMSALSQKQTAIAIPRLKTLDKGEPSDTSGEKSASVRTMPDIDTDGFCVVLGGQRVADMPISMCLANSLVSAKSKKTLMEVDRQGLPVVFDIIKIKRKFCFDKKDGKIYKARFVVDLNININECMTDVAVTTREFVDFAEGTVALEIKRQLIELFEFAKQNSADFLRLDKSLRLKHPYAYSGIEDYAQFFKALEIEPVVKVHLTRTYDIRQPVGKE